MRALTLAHYLSCCSHCTYAILPFGVERRVCCCGERGRSWFVGLDVRCACVLLSRVRLYTGRETGFSTDLLEVVGNRSWIGWTDVLGLCTYLGMKVMPQNVWANGLQSQIGDLNLHSSSWTVDAQLFHHFLVSLMARRAPDHLRKALHPQRWSMGRAILVGKSCNLMQPTTSGPRMLHSSETPEYDCLFVLCQYNNLKAVRWLVAISKIFFPSEAQRVIGGGGGVILRHRRRSRLRRQRVREPDGKYSRP